MQELCLSRLIYETSKFIPLARFNSWIPSTRFMNTLNMLFVLGSRNEPKLEADYFFFLLNLFTLHKSTITIDKFEIFFSLRIPKI